VHALKTAAHKKPVLSITSTSSTCAPLKLSEWGHQGSLPGYPAA
jgi:hypothetical protein